MTVHFIGAGPGAQFGYVDAERVHADLGDLAAVADPVPGHGCVQDVRAAVKEGLRPAGGKETSVIRAQHAVKHGPANMVRQEPVVGRRRPRGVREVGDPGPRRPVPQHPGSQRQVIILD